MPLTKEWSDQIFVVCVCICVCMRVLMCSTELKWMSSDSLGCWFLPSFLFERGPFLFLLTTALKPLGVFLPLPLISGNTGITDVYASAWLYRGFGDLSSSPHACNPFTHRAAYFSLNIYTQRKNVHHGRPICRWLQQSKPRSV